MGKGTTTDVVNIALDKRWPPRDWPPTMTLLLLVQAVTIAMRSSSDDEEDPELLSLTEGIGGVRESGRSWDEGMQFNGVSWVEQSTNVRWGEAEETERSCPGVRQKEEDKPSTISSVTGQV